MAFAIIASGYYPRCALDKTDEHRRRSGRRRTLLKGLMDWAIVEQNKNFFLAKAGPCAIVFSTSRPCGASDPCMTESSSLYQRAEASFAVMVIHAFVLHKLHRLGCFRCKILKQLIFSNVFGELLRMGAEPRGWPGEARP
jgi:hypothetical protein